MRGFKRCQGDPSDTGAAYRRRPVSLDLTQLVFMFFAALIIFGVYGRRGPRQ